MIVGRYREIERIEGETFDRKRSEQKNRNPTCIIGGFIQYQNRMISKEALVRCHDEQVTCTDLATTHPPTTVTVSGSPSILIVIELKVMRGV